MRRAAVLVLLLPALAAASSPARPPAAGDTLEIRRLVTRLAAPDFEGRRCGEPGGRAAADYLLGLLPELGLSPVPAAGDYALPFEFGGEELSSLEARLVSPEGAPLALWLSVRAPLRRSIGDRLLFGPEEEDPPLCQADEILLRFGPSGDRSFFSPSELQEAASRAGAGALVLMPHPDDQAGIYERDYSRVAERDRRLYSLAGEAPERVLAYAEPVQARELFPSPPDSSRGPWRLELPTGKPLQGQGRNLLARVGDRRDAERVLLIAAHFDHLGPSEDGYYPGADDNASSVAILLELARLLQGREAPCEIRLLLSDGEELGYLGAKAYLARFPAPWRMLNLDSLGRSAVDSYRKLRDPGALNENLLILWHSPMARKLAARLASIAADANFDIQPGEGPMFAKGGDHYVFAQAGVPSLFLFGGFHADYNTERDRAERILPERLARLAELLAEALTTGGLGD
jgi:hypothetical protein